MNVIFYLDSWGKIKNHKPKKPIGWVLMKSETEFFLYAENSDAEEILKTHFEKIKNVVNY